MGSGEVLGLETFPGNADETMDFDPMEPRQGLTDTKEIYIVLTNTGSRGAGARNGISASRRTVPTLTSGREVPTTAISAGYG